MRPYRKEKLASVVRAVVGEALLHRLQDPRIESLTTVTRVEVTSDLLIAKVFVSVHGDDAAERRTLQAMRHAAGFVQRMLARQLPVRHCPELRFEIDAGAKGARRTLELLDANRQKEPELYSPGPDPGGSAAGDGEEEGRAEGSPGEASERGDG
jgi:ribosome-binding factor A